MKSTQKTTRYELDDVNGFEITVEALVQFEKADPSVGYFNPRSYVDDWKIHTAIKLDSHGEIVSSGDIVDAETMKELCRRVDRAEEWICEQAAEELQADCEYAQDQKMERQREER